MSDRQFVMGSIVLPEQRASHQASWSDPFKRVAIDACEGKCAYCRRLGLEPICEGCGAPREPAPRTQAIEVTHLKSAGKEYRTLPTQTPDRMAR